MLFPEYHAAMFTPQWKTSPRTYGVVVERDVRVRMSDGVELSCDIWRPDSREAFPAIVGMHCYHQAGQTGPIKPTAISSAQWKHPNQERTNASLEAGDPTFFARRGYVHVVCNVRGTGKSGGLWQFVGPREVQDGYELIEWVARQPWCDGNVGMFGVSYLARIQLFVAQLRPPHLKALFCPWSATDFYRDIMYRGGILNYQWPIGWSRTSLTYAPVRPESWSLKNMGREKFDEAVRALLDDEHVRSVPEIVDVLKRPLDGVNPFIVDLLLHPTLDEFWQERMVDYNAIETPAFLGSDWASYGNHLPSAFRHWENLNVPKKMLIGPPVYLDRPVYQLQYEAIRWFDYWMKGIDTGIMEEPPIRVFVRNTGEWKEGSSWPFPNTRFTPFYLHENGLLSEHEHWSYEGSDSFEDSPWMRGSLKYVTPPLVEATEVVGPLLLKFYAATTDTDVHWIVSFLQIDPEGNETVLTKGWLKASHSHEVDEAESKPWAITYKHQKEEPLVPGRIYEFNVNLCPTGVLFPPGYRMGIKIACSDDPPKNALELIGSGSLKRSSVARHTVFHSEEYPSYLLVPITKGNLMNTYFSGGRLA